MAIGDDDRAFGVTQRGALNLAAGSGEVPVEAEAHGSFTEGQAGGTLALRFTERPECNAAPVTWTAAAP
jgi:hypothetical protein